LAKSAIAVLPLLLKLLQAVGKHLRKAQRRIEAAIL
jgi:hypothetical protein